VNLFQITNQIQERIQTLADSQAELGTPDGKAQEELAYEFNVLDLQFEEKVEAYCHVIRNREALLKAREEEVNRLQRLVRIDLNQIARMKAVIKEAMLLTGKTKLETELFKVRVQANGGKAPLKFCENYEVPDEFCRIKKEPDSDKIREAIEAGEVLDFAELLPRGNHLQIK
jgi:hypothetical protein